jgi:hypothetical protein
VAGLCYIVLSKPELLPSDAVTGWATCPQYSRIRV